MTRMARPLVRTERGKRSPGQRRPTRSSRRYAAARPGILGRFRMRPLSAWPLSSQLLGLGLLVIVAVLIAAGLWLALDDRFYVYEEKVRITGTHRIADEEVFQASDLAGLHILWVRPARAERLILQRLPGVEQVRVACGLPANCAIAVVERKPQITWDEGGTLWWIDPDGVIAPASAPLSEGWRVRGPLPLMELAEDSSTGDHKRLDEEVRIALDELWTTELDSSTVFEYVPGRGLVFTDPRGWRIVLGRGSGMADRLRLAQLLSEQLQRRGVVPRLIDVRFPQAPYYSVVNEW